jgi:hypothetical protein
VVRPAGEGEVVPELTYKGRRKRLFLFALFSPLAPLLYIWTVTYVSCCGRSRVGSPLVEGMAGPKSMCAAGKSRMLRSAVGSMLCVYVLLLTAIFFCALQMLVA